jgi:hypothetical protein
VGPLPYGDLSRHAELTLSGSFTTTVGEEELEAFTGVSTYQVRLEWEAPPEVTAANLIRASNLWPRRLPPRLLSLQVPRVTMTLDHPLGLVLPKADG